MGIIGEDRKGGEAREGNEEICIAQQKQKKNYLKNVFTKLLACCL